MIDAVVLGSSPTGLYALRELARAGFGVALADTARGCAFSSRHVRGPGRQMVADMVETRRWLDDLADARDSKILLLPTSDIFIEYVIEHAAELAERFAFSPCYNDVASRLLDKAQFHSLCQAHEMATPGVWLAHDREALALLVDEVPFPCILKPVLIHLAKDFLKGRKVILAKNRETFQRELAAIPEGIGSWMVQEIIPGAESEITLFAGYVDQRGTPVQSFTARKLRQYPPGFGSASLVSSVPCEETRSLTLAFLQRIGFRGICGAEFKRDPRDGQLKIIEINPRPTLWFEITHDAGKRIVEAAARDLLDRDGVAEQPQRTDVRWRYLLKDVVSRRFYQRHAGDFVFAAPDVSSANCCKRASWPVYAVDDCMPALVEPVGFLRKAWKRFA